MTDWKPLPDGLHPDAGRLVVELRRMKDRSGLSLTALARRTLHSRSSWERYLNGKAMPPRQAALRLGDLVGAEPARLGVLWDHAATAWRDRPAPAGRPEPAPDRIGPQEAAGAAGAAGTAAVPGAGGGGPVTESSAAEAAVPGRSRFALAAYGRRRTVTVALTGLLVCGGAGALIATSQGDHRTATTANSTAQKADSAARGLETNCYGESCTGKDPKQTGCAGDAWTAAMTRVQQQVYVELRYSDACRAAWARISWGRPGDVAQVIGGRGRTFRNTVHYDTDTFTAMTAASSPSGARACTVLTTAVRGCTRPGGTQRLTEPPEPPARPQH